MICLIVWAVALMGLVPSAALSMRLSPNLPDERVRLREIRVASIRGGVHKHSADCSRTIPDDAYATRRSGACVCLARPQSGIPPEERPTNGTPTLPQPGLLPAGSVVAAGLCFNHAAFSSARLGLPLFSRALRAPPSAISLS